MMFPSSFRSTPRFFALIFVLLSMRVIQMRGDRPRSALGDGSNPALERRIRVQGNFAEYVPMALILLLFVELQAQPRMADPRALPRTARCARCVHAYRRHAGQPENIRDARRRHG